MVIGIPKEIMHDEGRVSAIPETVKKLVADGNKVLVEKGAGVGSFFPDADYAAAGAELVDDVADLYKRSDLILKVKEPLYNEAKKCHEIDMMHKGQYLITFIHPASPVNHEMVKKMAKQGVIGLTLDGVPRISRAQNMDALTSMSTCAGYKGILMAASDLPKFMPQIFCAVGMIKPVNALIVAGLQALATAKRLGAVTYAMDIRPAALEQATSLGAKPIDPGVPAELAMAPGGYAQRLPDEWLEKERQLLAEKIKDMDVVFCSALIPGKLAPVIVTEEFETSNFWHKLAHMLWVYYWYKSPVTVNLDGYKDFPILGYQFYEFSDGDKLMLRQDWLLVRDFLIVIHRDYRTKKEREQQYPRLSHELRSQLMLIDTAPKFPNNPRFRLKRAYATVIADQYFSKKHFEKLDESIGKYADIDWKCQVLTNKYKGKTFKQIANSLKVDINLDAKNFAGCTVRSV